MDGAARTLNPVWSPDSKWVAYSSRLRSLYHAIFISNVETGETKQITDGLADAVWPTWDASGKYVWFLASTDFGLRSQWLDMTSYESEIRTSGSISPYCESLMRVRCCLRVTKIAALVRAREDCNPVRARAMAAVLLKVAAVVKAVPEVVGCSTWSTCAGRLCRSILTVWHNVSLQFPACRSVSTRIFRPVSMARCFISRQVDPVLVVEVKAVSRVMSCSVIVSAIVVRRHSSATLRLMRSARTVASLFIARPLVAVVRAVVQVAASVQNAPAPQLFLVDADRTPPQPGSGRLNYSLRMYLEPREEFKQIFNEGWRNQRDYLYVPNMQGADWPKMREMYGQLLPYVRHRADLNYLMDMMGAEIAIGHSYVRGGDMPTVPQPVAGLLGADFAIENGRYKVTRIYDNESWNPDLRSPLATPGANVNAGDYILAINGIELIAPDNIYRLLDGTANRQTTLTVNTTPSMQGARTVTVIPVANEQALRTRAWVESNRRLVEKLSDGQLAYVYLPNTGQPGYTSFNRYYFSQQDKKGVVVDERFNGGGSAADYIIEVLARDFDGYFNNVAGDRYPFTSPSAGIWGPKVMIINEMAGSGGDLMPYMFKRRKIGPLIGKRTWGGLVHTADTPPFIDGGSMIAPRGGFFTRDGKWAVENEGVGPDIDVENWPKDVVAGRDPQLERAVQEAMRMLKERPVERLPKEPAPPTWGKRP